MVYESQMIKLARGAVAAHGKLLEVIFMNKSTYDSRLVFSDGTILPVKHRQAGYDISQESYTYQVAIELGGTDPFSMLTFGYTGTGPTCYSTFLRTAGFRNPDVEDIEAPLKLRPDGSRVRGTVRGDWVEWDDGSEKTPLKYGTREEGKHCVSCGALIPTDALYCPKCGLKQDGVNEKKAAGLYPYEAIIFMNLGVSYAEKGQFEEGIKYLEKALSIDPRNERVRRNLEDVKMARERKNRL